MNFWNWIKKFFIRRTLDVPICPHCKGENIVMDAPVYWSKENQLWYCVDPYDKSAFCSDCDDEIRYADWITI